MHCAFLEDQATLPYPVSLHLCPKFLKTEIFASLSMHTGCLNSISIFSFLAFLT